MEPLSERKRIQAILSDEKRLKRLIMEPLSERKRIQAILSHEKRLKVQEALQDFVFDDDKLHQMVDIFEGQIKLANSTDENLRKQTDLFWENTFVRHLLDGSENGTYLGLDLGGTNFRIVRVDMTDGEAQTETKYYNLEKHLLRGQSSGIFDHIAVCLQSFLKEGTFPSNGPLSIGFTFSFPSFQTSLKKCIMQTWTKSIACTDGPGLDPILMLQESIERKGGLPIPVNIVGRISDTTGTLLAGNLIDKRCRIGLIVGTGSNAAFVEYIKNIERWDECYKDAEDSDLVVINSEFGALGDNGCLNFMKNEIDHEVDKHSNHPGSYTFEKTFSGLYLGEVVRLALVRLTKLGLLFSGQATDKLLERWRFTTAHVTAVESDVDESTENTLMVLEEFDLKDVATAEDINLTREVCALLSKRGAYLVATAMVVFLNHINLPEVTIAIDGTLYQRHPKYHQHIMDVVSKYRPGTKTTIVLVKDGSGQGGALVAAIEGKKQLIES